MPNLIQFHFLMKWYEIYNEFLHTTGLIRHQGFQEKCKKANKGHKGQIKGQRVQIAKNLDFLVFLWLFGVKDAMFFLFWIFKTLKTKKAAIVAQNANLHYGKFIEPGNPTHTFSAEEIFDRSS